MAFQQNAFQPDAFQVGPRSASATVIWPWQSDAFQFWGGIGPTPPTPEVVASSTILIPDPRYLDWEIWSGQTLLSALGVYNLPNPVDEGLWQAWATELLNITGFASRGSPDPRGYGEDWRAWAMALIMTAS